MFNSASISYISVKIYSTVSKEILLTVFVSFSIVLICTLIPLTVLNHALTVPTVVLTVLKHVLTVLNHLLTVLTDVLIVLSAYRCFISIL